MKGGIFLSSYGSLITKVYLSEAVIPLSGAKVSVSQAGKPLAEEYTDASGMTRPIVIPAPNVSQSVFPNRTEPYAAVDLQVSYPGCRPVTVEGVQIFPGIETVQTVQLQPLSSAVPGRPTVFPTQTQPL